MKHIIAAFFCLILCSIFGQDDGIWLHPNRGQWQNPILYKVELNFGEMYLENNGFTYSLNDFKQQMSHNHAEGKKDEIENAPKILHSQIIKSTFSGSSW